MSDIPKARRVLERLALHLTATGLTGLAGRVTFALSLMTREKPVRQRAPVQAAKITPRIVDEVKTLAKRNIPLTEIAYRVGVNPGRVSEVLHGKRRGVEDDAKIINARRRRSLKPPGAAPS